ncbi:hypothetical protein RQP46_002940 [Phenoliferia psychrophenolica]
MSSVTALKQSAAHIEDRAVITTALANPLSGIPREQLFRDVEEFARSKDLLEHLPMLQKGALLAQSPHDFDHIDMLDAKDKENIHYEHANKWSHPRTLSVFSNSESVAGVAGVALGLGTDSLSLFSLTILLSSLGACVQGWDQTGSNGANLSFPVAFGISDAKTDPNYATNVWLVGLVNAAPYIASALFGCWISDPLNKYFGRRGCIFITAFILIVTPIASGFTQNWQQLFVVRLILGIGMGAKGSTVPIFAAENAPAEIRGALVMGWQLWTAFGIFLGFCANVIVADTGAIAWRLQLGSAFIPAVPLMAGIYFCPESPRWLMRKGRYSAAYNSLKRLRHHELQAARDLYYIHVMLDAELAVKGGASYIGRFIELFTIPRVRRATIASFVVMLAQQMCGINIIAFYSSTVFVEAGLSARKALYASLGFGAINFVFAFPALFTIDTFGRRSLLLATFPNMAWCLLAVAFAFLAPNKADGTASTVKLALIALFIYIFAMFYSVGEGPVPFAYSAEVFPLAQREQGMAWAVATCLFWAAVLSMTFPAMLRAMTPTGAFAFYAGLNMIAFIMIFFLLPETKQRTLEELDQVFSVPTTRFMSYQVKETLPYWLNRYILRNKDAKLAPLFIGENEAASSQAYRAESKRDLEEKI